MTDDEFRAAIQQVIEQDDSDDGWITTGWILTRASIRADDAHEGVAGLTYQTPDSQALHISRGLIEMARTHYESAARDSTPEGNDER